jgi:integrase
VLGSVHVANQELTTEPVIGGHHTLAGARRLVATLRHEIAQGRDPGAAHLTGRQLRRADIANTFGAAARDFIEQYAKKRTRRWQDQARVLGLRPDGIIRGGLVERWSNKSVADIGNHDIYIIVDECRRLGVPGLERRKDGPNESRAMVMLSTLSRMFGWLARHRRIEKNPCAGVHRPDAPRARDRVLTDAEIARFWPAAAAERVEFSAPLKLLLLTGCRLNEVAGMRRSELSDDGATWHIPGARTKNKRPHIVPLQSLARDLIASVDMSIGSQLSDDERDPLSHQTADEMDIAAEPIEFRDDDRALQPAGYLESRGKLLPAVERVSALASLDLGESLYDVAALGSGKPGDGIALGLEVKPRAALLLGADRHRR